MCITVYQATDTKSNPNPNRTTKQHAIVNIQLNIVVRSLYPEKIIQEMLLHYTLLLTAVFVIRPFLDDGCCERYKALALSECVGQVCFFSSVVE